MSIFYQLFSRIHNNAMTSDLSFVINKNALKNKLRTGEKIRYS